MPIPKKSPVKARTQPERTIWKFLLDPDSAGDTVRGGVTIDMPEGAIVLTVMSQRDEAFIWAEVDPSAELETRVFYVYGTGHPITHESAKYIGTFMVSGDSLVFHVYEPN